MNVAVPFPEERPVGYEWLPDEVPFDPDKHLALEPPASVNRSRWLLDLCISPEVTEAMCDIYGTRVAPHSMPVQLGHLNFEPANPTEAVDKWHHDTVPLDYVMMVRDPTRVAGGRFEYFLGTKAEAAALAAQGRTPPPDRVALPDFPGPGHAIALHGNMASRASGACWSAPARGPSTR